MSTSDAAFAVIREHIANIDYGTEAKTNEIKELKKVRRKLVNSLEAMENL